MFIVSLPHYLKFILWPDQRALSSSENPPSLFPAAFSVFSCKRTESSGGDVLIRRILGKAEGENADNNSGIVGYYFGSLAQTESSCCPAAEPKQPVHLPREAEKRCVCVLQRATASFWIHGELLVQKLLEKEGVKGTERWEETKPPSSSL